MSSIGPGGGDFLGAFGVLRRGERILMTLNARVLGGQPAETWDLPGGRVEPGELLLETLAREVFEETGVVVRGVPRFLFVQEGERIFCGQRHHAWRSFFFAVDEFGGEPAARSEVLAVQWFAPEELRLALHAPYHDSFLDWLAHGGTVFRSRWDD
jgi:ADP-ribose pyrophosphatase YjhB (NUDIX family)